MPPSLPPSTPPNSVPLLASADFVVRASDSQALAASDTRTFASLILGWADARARSAGDDSTSIDAAITESINLTTRSVLTRADSVDAYVARVAEAARLTLCFNALRCEVTAQQLPSGHPLHLLGNQRRSLQHANASADSPTPALPPAVPSESALVPSGTMPRPPSASCEDALPGGWLINVATHMWEGVNVGCEWFTSHADPVAACNAFRWAAGSPRVLCCVCGGGTRPHAPPPPARPPPPTPPAPLPPMVPSPAAVEVISRVTARRTRDAQAIVAQSAPQPESGLAAINATVIDLRVTQLDAAVRIAHVARDSSTATPLARAFFEELRNRSRLESDLAELLSVRTLPTVELIQVEIDGRVTHGGVDLESGNALAPTAEGTTTDDLQLTAATIDAIAATASAVVATTVVASVATSVIASVAGTAAASMSASAAAGAAGSAAGGVAPLIFGAQRFVTTSSLAANVSELQRSVADSVAWITGDVSVVSIAPSRGRRLSEPLSSSLNATEATPPPRVRTALDRLLSAFVVVATILLVSLLVHAYFVHRWRHRVNASFYEAKRNPKLFLAQAIEARRSGVSSVRGRRAAGSKADVRAGHPPKNVRTCEKSSRQLASNAAGQTRGTFRGQSTRRRQNALSEVRFTPFPSPLVFPGVPVLVVQVFCTGIVLNAVRLVADDRNCTEWSFDACRAFGGGIIVAVVLYQTFTLSLVLHFHRHYRASTWHRSPYPSEPHKVVDPLYRIVSRARTWLLPASHPSRVIDRPKGAFKKPAAHSQEPARTYVASDRTPPSPAWVRQRTSERPDVLSRAVQGALAGESAAVLASQRGRRDRRHRLRTDGALGRRVVRSSLL